MKGDKMINLENRVWPKRPDIKVEGYDPYVREGRVFSRALQYFQNLSEPIPAGESAITSLCRGFNGKIYGVTSGAKSHLFYYDPSPDADGVCDIGVIDNATSVRSLVPYKDGRIFGGISTTLSKDVSDGGLFHYETKIDKMNEGGTSKGKIEYNILVPIKNEGIGGMVIDNKRDRIYGISTKTGTFFIYDIAKDTIALKGKVQEKGYFSCCLVVDSYGHVYGGGHLGRIFRYDIDLEKICKLKVRIPSVAGRGLYNIIDSMVFDESRQIIYGGGKADGVLFAFDPQEGKIISIGKVITEPRVRALTVGNDGKVYGVAGNEEGMGHLFVYNPETRDLKDLGILLSASEKFWHAYEIESAVTGEFGEIYLGESDRISHLFIYFPPIKSQLPYAETENRIEST